MLAHTAQILRPALQPSRVHTREQNPGTLGTVLLVGGVLAAGVIAWDWWDGRAQTETIKKAEWIYWAEEVEFPEPLMGPFGFRTHAWRPWLQRPDGQVLIAAGENDYGATREDAEQMAHDAILKYGGTPVLSYGAPQSLPAPGLEGAPVKNNYVGLGWFWPHQDLFPSESEILRFFSSLGYATSGYEVLSVTNMEAAKRYQADYNLVITHARNSNRYDAQWPAGLVVDGLLGDASLQSMALIKLSLLGEDQKAAWRALVTEAKKFAAIPLAVKQILRLGYGSFDKWFKTNAKGRRAMIRPFQDDYNCVIQGTGRSSIDVDGQVGPQTKDAAAYATSLVESTGSGWDAYVAAC